MAAVDRFKLMGIEPEAGVRRRRGRVLGQKGVDSHCYHLMSRTCGGEIWFDDVEKEAMVKLIGKMSRFCGIEVLTYCVMGNHFHVLVRVPDKERWMLQFEGTAGEERLLEHLGLFYSRPFMEALRSQLGEDRRMGDEAAAQARLGTFKERLCDVSGFMKELKTRYTKWYNKRHERRGTLWMERFKSVLIEDKREKTGMGEDALRVMGLYIDLNPVRAGLVEDPKDYRWSGYGAAMGGEKGARKGIMELTGLRSWVKAGEVWRMWLYGEGLERKAERPGVEGQEGPGARRGVDGEERVKVLAERGKMGLGEMLRCRVRYFSDGVVMGSREFVRGYRQRGEEDERKVPRVRELERGAGLHVMRQLRVEAVARRSTQDGGGKIR